MCSGYRPATCKRFRTSWQALRVSRQTPSWSCLTVSCWRAAQWLPSLRPATGSLPCLGGAYSHRGGIFTYGPRLSEAFRRLAYFTTRILKGAKPTDLPIERPTVFELVLNLRTAKQIGLAVPFDLLALADETIE